jgi:hypothetical protein
LTRSEAPPLVVEELPWVEAGSLNHHDEKVDLDHSTLSLESPVSKIGCGLVGGVRT